MRNRLAKRQSGFTLIEIAIVLVIIGILIVGVLQGQEMIENSKTKSIINDMKGIGAAYNSYLDRYRSVPGDEVQAVIQNRGWGNTIFGNGDGILTAATGNTFNNNAGEGRAMWQSLYASGFLAGDPTQVGAVALPKHKGGGTLGVAAGQVYGMTGTFVCASNLTSKQAGAIDLAIDGPPAAATVPSQTGIVRGAQGAAPLVPTPGLPPATQYNETVATPWTVCLKIG